MKLMLQLQNNYPKLAKNATLAALTIMICWGLLLVIAQIKPFTVDEWRIIYNIKYKSATGLWGPLDFVQQFPRVYLEVFKAFTSVFDYSYFTLRLPSFLLGVASIALAWKLMNRIFGTQLLSRFLMVLFIIASPAFLAHFVEVKPYTMDILLSLVGIWQLLQLQDLMNGAPVARRRYVLLCLSFVAAPFFSYTYAIVISPLFFIVFMFTIKTWMSEKKWLTMPLFLTWLSLICGAISILAFYRFDALQLMQDNNMHLYWSYLMMPNSFNLPKFCMAFYNLFALAGSGLFFEILFGLLGLLAFGYAVKKCVWLLKKQEWGTEEFINWYCAGLVVVVLALYSLGKLPIGERRLNAYILPVAGILIVSYINRLRQIRAVSNMAGPLHVIIIIGVTGNLVTSPINELQAAKHERMLDIYVNTENAILEARAKQMPIFITPAVAYPFEKKINYPKTNIAANELCLLPGYIDMGCGSPGANIPGDWVLKTFPAFKPDSGVAVYTLWDMSELANCMKRLPPGIKAVMAGDGLVYKIVERTD